jgi:DNA-binding response OmpR family regulator
VSLTSSKGWVLIVDDDASVREYVRMLLEQTGYSVMTVDDGHTALAYLGRVRADVILLDLMMPVLDGWSFAEAVRADRELSRIPIIVYSASVDGALPGVAATLLKPSTPEELLSTIERVLTADRRRSPRYPARFSVHAAGSGNSPRTTTHNISSGGISFDTTSQTYVGERLRVVVELAVNGTVVMEVMVRHAVRTPKGWRVGAELLTVESNATGFDAELALLALNGGSAS